MAYTTQRVYSSKVATKLVNKGYKLIRVEPNPKKEGFVRYIFIWTDTIEKEMREVK